MNPFFFLLAAAILIPSFANADRKSDIAALLKDFGKNSAEVMDRLPQKLDARTGRPVASRTAFTPEQIASGEFVTLKDQARQNLCTSQGGARVCLGEVLPGRAVFEDNDLAENLVDNPEKMLRTLDAMEAAHLSSAKLDESPWSSTYWPIYEGRVAARYADPQFPASQNWSTNFDYIQAHGLWAIFKAGDATAIDNLSPAEKYDLLVGDADGALAASNWAVGQDFFNSEGHVESWMGICHGWSPASYMVPRPKHTIDVLAHDGKTKLTFYPADIKGLAALLWAQNKGTVRMIGGRCNEKRPRVDHAGRIVSQDCFDTNPGTWHLAVVNQIGQNKRSFVIDATYDYQVWNQPVYAYSYTYFNPQTRQPVEHLADARVAMSDFTEDRFKKYRADAAIAVVGIAMDLTYIQETDPTHAATDAPEADSPHQVRYMYDLELNEKSEIIGGEWYENAHPDFMWTPAPTDRVDTLGDSLATDAWDGQTVLPESWSTAAASTSKSAGTPLSKIIDVLSARAHQ